MSENDDISPPTKVVPEPRPATHPWPVRVLLALITIFVGLNLYAIALKFLPVPGTILMAQRAIDGDDVNRNWTRLEDISPFLVSAVIAGEDARFCQHEGIDWTAIQDALSDNQTRNRRRGGSTITQQTAKNVFLWNGGGFVRKVPETWMASFIDFVWGKKRVIETYLNVAEWGDGLFGAEAAARARFGKSAKALTPREAALLASVLPSPNKWRLDPPSEFVNRRARTLQARLYVVRNEGYADCVLGKPKKRIGPAPKPKPTPKPEYIDEPRIVEPKSTVDPAMDQVISETDPEIIKEAPDPISASPEITAPESEEETGIQIDPEPE